MADEQKNGFSPVGQLIDEKRNKERAERAKETRRLRDAIKEDQKEETEKVKQKISDISREQIHEFMNFTNGMFNKFFEEQKKAFNDAAASPGLKMRQKTEEKLVSAIDKLTGIANKQTNALRNVNENQKKTNVILRDILDELRLSSKNGTGGILDNIRSFFGGNKSTPKGELVSKGKKGTSAAPKIAPASKKSIEPALGFGSKALKAGSKGLIGAGVSIASDVAADALKTNGYEKAGATLSVASDTLGYGATGAALGSLGGPIGTGIGGALGALYGLLSSIKENQKYFQNNTTSTAIDKLKESQKDKDITISPKEITIKSDKVTFNANSVVSSTGNTNPSGSTSVSESGPSVNVSGFNSNGLSNQPNARFEGNYSGRDGTPKTKSSVSSSKNLNEKAAIARTQVQDQLEKEAKEQGVKFKNPKIAAAAIAGQGYQESGYDPTKVHDRGTGLGVYGHRLNRRDEALKWIKDHGYDKNDMEGWNRYAAHEIMSQKGFAKLKSSLLETDNLPDSTQKVTEIFERPAKQHQIPGSQSMLGRQYGARQAMRDPSEFKRRDINRAGDENTYKDDGSKLRIKSAESTAGGPAEEGVIAVAKYAQSAVPGFNRVTAFNDRYHQNLSYNSAHKDGRAGDFTLTNPTEQAEGAISRIKDIANKAGVSIYVRDEYNNPSGASSAGHIHYQFKSKEDAAKFNEYIQKTSQANIRKSSEDISKENSKAIQSGGLGAFKKLQDQRDAENSKNFVSKPEDKGIKFNQMSSKQTIERDLDARQKPPTESMGNSKLDQSSSTMVKESKYGASDVGNVAPAEDVITQHFGYAFGA